MKNIAACNRHETIKQANRRFESEAGFMAALRLPNGPNEGKQAKIDRSCEKINHLSSEHLRIRNRAIIPSSNVKEALIKSATQSELKIQSPPKRKARTNFCEKILAQKSELVMIRVPPVRISPPLVGLGLNGGVETLE